MSTAGFGFGAFVNNALEGINTGMNLREKYEQYKARRKTRDAMDQSHDAIGEAVQRKTGMEPVTKSWQGNELSGVQVTASRLGAGPMPGLASGINVPMAPSSKKRMASNEPPPSYIGTLVNRR